MNRLLEILARLAAGFAGLDDTALQAELDELAAAAAEAGTDPASLTDEDLGHIRQAATVAGEIRTEQATRFEAAATRAAGVAAALAEIAAANADDDPEVPPVTPDAVPPAAPEPAPADPPADPAPVDPPPAEPVPTPVAEASTHRPMIRANARRATPAPAPVEVGAGANISHDVADWGLTASAGHPTLREGDRIQTNRELAASFEAGWGSTRGGHSGPNQYIPIVSRAADMRALYGPDRFLDRDPIENARKLAALVDPWEIAARHEAAANGGEVPAGGVLASGGICAPIPPSYDLPVYGTDSRSFRDRMMTRFGAETRGGIRTMEIPTLEEVAGAIGFWTEENDRTPGAGAIVGDRLATKPCLTIGCGDENEDLVYAVTRCFKTGNFRAKFFPEQIAAYMRLILVSNARQAEQRLMTKVESDSTLSTYGAPATTLGTVPTLLAALDLLEPAIRQPDRLPGRLPMLFGAPFWLVNQARTDMARRLPFGTTDENYALSDQKIEGYIRARGYEPVWLIDGLSGQMFARPADGALANYPSTAVTYVWPAGTWLFLDGGELNLGMVRDSTLNSTNDVEFWAETFEGAHRHGLHSHKLTLTLSPTGEVSGTTDITA